MDGVALGKLITLGFFGAAGWFVARRWTVPAAARTWCLLLGAAVVGSVIGTETRVVSVFGIDILLNWVILSSCLGALVRLWLRTRSLRRGPGGSA